jgi:hypothetical protein
MNKFTPSLAAFGITMAACLPVSAAPITWVAETGSDANPCSNPSPCSTLTKALSLTDPAGEVRILGQGSFEEKTVVIRNAVSIVSDTSQGGVLGWAGGPTILIQAGPADAVHLRGLIIEGAGKGDDGIRFESGAALHVQNSVVRGFQSGNGYGIHFIPSNTAALFVSDTLIANNGAIVPNPKGAAAPPLHIGGGILIAPLTGMATVSIDRTHLEKNIVGISASAGAAGQTLVSVWDSVMAGNLDFGIAATSKSAPTTIVLERSAVVNSYDAGVQADGALSKIYVGNSTISGNTTGLRAVNNGVLKLQMNNTIVANKDNVVEPAESQ